MSFKSKVVFSALACLCGLQSEALADEAQALADQVYELPVSDANALSVMTLSTFAQGEIVDSIPQLGVVVTRTKSADLRARAAGFRSLGEVSEVRLIAPVTASKATNPESAPATLWGLKAIHLAKAWPVTKGAGVIVAVSDTGVSSAHPDLVSQMWKNPGETGLDSKGNNKANNGIDDDGDGYVDDVHGWNFVTNKPSGVDNQLHGSHVAGTIAALPTKNMTGIAPRAKLMDVSFLSSTGKGSDVNAAKTIVYAVDHGAKIINCSWSGPNQNNLLKKAIDYAESRGVLLIVAAGNSNVDNDKKPSYPNSYDFENIISIGATSSDGGSRADFSNYGRDSVELAAPGDGIKSLKPIKGYATLSGTSMATPHVAGVAALIWSAHPQYTYSQVKRALMATRPASGWKGKSVTEGQLDAELALSH